MFTLTDEAAELRETDVARIDDHFLVPLRLEQNPPASLVCWEVALGMDRRYQVGLVTYGPYRSNT